MLRNEPPSRRHYSCNRLDAAIILELKIEVQTRKISLYWILRIVSDGGDKDIEKNLRLMNSNK